MYQDPPLPRGTGGNGKLLSSGAQILWITCKVKRMAQSFALRNWLRHPFLKERDAAGQNGSLFLGDTVLSFRKPLSLFAAWIHGFSQDFFYIYFKARNVQHTQKKNCPNWVTHVDETGITTTFHKTRNVIGLKGKKDGFEDCRQVKGRFW
jgi:hypothetical protein